MNIEEATALKHQLTKDIAKMLSTFTAATGLSIGSLDIEKLYTLGGTPSYIVEVEVKL